MKIKLNYPIFSWMLIGITLWAILALAGYGAYYLVIDHDVAPAAIKQGNPNHIPDIFEIQQMLLDKGFDLGPKGIDGRLGDSNSYTRKAWDRNSYNQYNREIYKRMVGERK